MRSILLLFITSISFVVNASEYKFGKVSPSEVEQKAHEKEPEARGAILSQKGDVTMTYNTSKEIFQIETKVYKKIKVYTKDGLDLGTVSIPYYTGAGGNEKVTKIKGEVYNLVDGKVEKTKLSKNNIFDEETSKRLKKKKIAFPNVKEGSVIELEYTIISPYNSRIPKWYFQYDIPCDKTEYKVETPHWFKYEVSATGTVSIQRTSEEKSRAITFRIVYDASNDEKTVKKQVKMERVEYRGEITNYSTGYVPSLSDEEFVPNMNNYRSALTYELASTYLPGSTYKRYTTSWAGISNMLYNHDDLGKQFTKDYKFNKEVVSKASALSPDEKAKYLYEYVRDTYTWDGYNGHFSSKGLKGLAKEKNGNVGDINLMLSNLLRSANLPVNVVVMRTRESGFLNYSHPTQNELNYLIVQYENEAGEKILLDATADDLEFGFLPDRALNRNGVLVLETQGQKIGIDNPNSSSNRIISKMTFDEDFNLKVDCTRKIKGYQAMSVFRKLEELGDEDSRLDWVESMNPGRAYESMITEGDGSELKCSEEFLIENVVESVGDKIYIDAFAGFYSSDRVFVEEERNYPIFMDQLNNQNITLQIPIPEGYEVEEIPEKTVLALPEDIGKFRYVVSSSKDKLIVTIKIEEKSDVILPAHYKAAKVFYDMIATVAEKKIVFKKV